MIQITVSEKLVKRIVGDYIADQLEEFSNKDFKAAGVPAFKQLVEQVLADAKFQKSLSKRLAVFVNDGDAIHDALDEMPMPTLEAVLKKLGAVA